MSDGNLSRSSRASVRRQLSSRVLSFLRFTLELVKIRKNYKHEKCRELKSLQTYGKIKIVPVAITPHFWVVLYRI